MAEQVQKKTDVCEVPVTSSELERLAALSRFGILGTAPEPVFDDMTKLAASLCETPYAAITLLDEGRLWFKSRVGIPFDELNREGAFCTVVVACRTVLIVPDALMDERFASNPLVTGEAHIRAYLGAPLIASDGFVLGAFSVLDIKPREFTAAQMELVEMLARQTMAQMELQFNQRELEESQRSQQALMNNLPGLAYRCRKAEEWTMAFVSGGCHLLTGHAPDALTGERWQVFNRMILEEERDQVWQAIQAAVAKREPYEVTYRIRTGDSRTRWVLERGRGIYRSTGDAMEMEGIIIDITAQKQAEQHLQRINRLYAVLSNVNHAIIRTRDLQPLYEEVCRIVVVDGGLKMAWVGMIAPEQQRVVPVCSWGEPQGYPDLINITMDGGPNSLGPGGVAARTGDSARCNDIENDPVMAPWRETALGHGFRSSAAFPLMVDGRPIGILVVIAGQSGYFNDDQMQLICMLAENLSFAIESVRKEKQRVDVEGELKRIRFAVENATDGIGLADMEGLSIYHNRAFRDVLGYTTEQLNQLGGIVGIAVDAERARKILAVVRAGHSWSGDMIFREVGGRLVELFMRGDAIRDDEGRIIALLGIFTDLSQQKTAARKIAEQAALLDKARDAILVTSLDDRVLYWNKSAERLYGWPAEDAVGWQTGEFINFGNARFLEGKAAVLEHGEWMGELTQNTADGRGVVVECRLTLVRDKQGLPKSILAINSDIGDKKRLESQFLRAQRMESIGTMAGGIAHDLNNVLTPITMSLSLLAMKLTSPQEQKLLDLLQNSANRGADMVRQILTFARGVEGKRVLVHLNVLVDEVERMLKETFPKAITIEVTTAPGLWTIEGDPTQLHQVLLNLAINARDAMKDGGSLFISCRNVQVDGPFASMIPDGRPGPYVLVQIRDTGTGIPMEIRDRVFEPFFTTKELGTGSGLGLPTCLAIVKSHGGFIDLHSEHNRGTNFAIYLPRSETSATEEEEVPPAQNDLLGTGELILVVDDEDAIRMTAAQSLENYGYRTLTAANGMEAIEVLLEHSSEISVVVTDMMMPVMDGPSAIQAMRRIRPDLRIIGASGLNNELVARARSLGVQEFLLKPYGAEQLLRALQSQLRQGTD